MQFSLCLLSFFPRHHAASSRRRGAGCGLQLHQRWRLQDPGGEWTSSGEWDLRRYSHRHRVNLIRRLRVAAGFSPAWFTLTALYNEVWAQYSQSLWLAVSLYEMWQRGTRCIDQWNLITDLLEVADRLAAVLENPWDELRRLASPLCE